MYLTTFRHENTCRIGWVKEKLATNNLVRFKNGSRYWNIIHQETLNVPKTLLENVEISRRDRESTIHQ